MNQRKLLLQLLPGFIPLFIFIIADEIWGTKIGLVVAIASGIIELAYYWFKDRKFDKFILFDTLLIVALGLISLALDNDIFFKLKPALIGSLMCIILGLSVFTPNNILLGILQRYLKGVELNEQQYLEFKKKIRSMFYIFVAYTLLVFYSAFFMSKEAWVFISGGLFYIILGVYFVYEFMKNRIKLKKAQQEEWLPLVDEQGMVIGKAPRSICHSDKKYLHPVVHLHVLNQKGQIYLQKRPTHKKVQPGKWDTSVGGHISFGEDIETSLKREAEEEIGLKDFKSQLVSTYIWESEIEREYIFCFVTLYEGPFKVNEFELSEGKFWSQQEIKSALGKGIFTPNFEEEYNKIISRIRRS